MNWFVHSITENIEMNIHNDNPCRVCEMRSTGCHIRCEEYQDYLKEREKIKAFNKHADAVANYYVRVHERATKRSGKKVAIR